MLTAIEKIQNHEAVSPGMEAGFTEACQPGDGIWQGDLGLEIVEAVPAGYVKVATTLQLVPGVTQGSKHCLDDVKGVAMFLPKGWNDESLIGPCFVTTKARKVLHPTHGAVRIPAGFTILCRYQREWDKVLAAERRAQD